MRLLEFLVSNLDDFRRLEPVLADSGRTLAGRGVGAEHFTAARRFMLEALRDLSGSRWTPLAETCWEQALAAASGIMLRAGVNGRAKAA